MKKRSTAKTVLWVLLICAWAWTVTACGGPTQNWTTGHTQPSTEQTLPVTESSAEQTTEPATLTTTEAETAATTEAETVETTEASLSWISWMTFPEDRQLQSSKYFVYDVSTDTFITCAGSGERVYPASITKLFTYYVASQYLSPDTVVTVGEEMSLVAWDASVAGLVRGDRLTVAQLLRGLLLPSGNDAAYVLAANAGRAICGDPDADYLEAVNRFVAEMNAQAAYLGMTGSHFCNPDGMHDDDHYMSVEDLALLGKLSLEDSAVQEVTRTPKIRAEFVYTAQRSDDYYYYGMDAEGNINWSNTNSLIDPASEYYCPLATGLKTGSTSAAGNCLLSSFDVEGRALVIGVFGAAEYAARFQDTLQLLNSALGVN